MDLLGLPENPPPGHHGTKQGFPLTPASHEASTQGVALSEPATLMPVESLAPVEMLASYTPQRWSALARAGAETQQQAPAFDPTEAFPLRSQTPGAWVAESSHEQTGLLQPDSPNVTCTVTTTANSGAGSLRQCLLSASQNDTIVFDPAVFPPAAPATIAPSSPLPIITVNGLTIDGSNAGVILNGSALALGVGLVISGTDGVTIRGLQIVNFPEEGVEITGGARNSLIGGETASARNVISGNGLAGIWINGVGTNGNRVQGNTIGVNATGTAAFGNGWGVVIGSGAQANQIGGTTAGARNLIGGNLNVGVLIQNAMTDGNQVRGNYIGTNAAGTAAIGSRWGVLIGFGSKNNVVGGTTPGARNLISGNGTGVQFQNTGTISNTVLGNTIGLNAAGTAALGNEYGVIIGFGAQDNIVGGDASGARNLISGNLGAGVQIQNDGTTGNRILGNTIGTTAAGTAALGNLWGVLIGFGSKNNAVGGTTLGARNLISGNGFGVQIEDVGTTGNTVLGNTIGTDPSGMTALGNGEGINIGFGAQNNLIGGMTAGARNVISGNTDAGIVIGDPGTTGNQVLGNIIGLNAAGTAVLGNGYGVVVGFGAQNNRVGGAEAGARNIISGNAQVGVLLQDVGTTTNTVLGNTIGTDSTGTIPLGNLFSVGVGISKGAQSNTIGGAAGAGNLISGSYVGVQIQGDGTSHNTVLGNTIGANISGTLPLGNTVGVAITQGAQRNTIGGTTDGARNIISGNDIVGVLFQDTETSGNQVLGNTIGLNAAGAASLGNRVGVAAIGGAHNNRIGDDMDGARNTISGNTEAGVAFLDPGTTGNAVLGNYIGTDSTGIYRLENPVGVLISSGALTNTIGGVTASARNIISGNAQYGIKIDDIYNLGTFGNQVLGNYIGTNVSGTLPLSNTVGILLASGVQDNTIGGATAGARNVISGNSNAGILLQDNGTMGNTVLGNTIGTNAMGTAALGNFWGVVIAFGANHNVVGGATPGARNLISGNGDTGVMIQNSGTSGNQVLGNTVGTDVTGSMFLGNGWGVVIIASAANNIVGGDTSGAGNLISRNAKEGIVIAGGGTTGNQVTHNEILTNTLHGVHLRDGASLNKIGPGNTIAYNGGAGVKISGATRNTITRNSIYQNGGPPIMYNGPAPIAPILLCHEPVDAESIIIPVGEVCPDCLFEFFANPDSTLAGTVFLTDTTTLPMTLTLPSGFAYLADTVTNKEGTTSEFASVPKCPGYEVYLPLIQK